MPLDTFKKIQSTYNSDIYINELKYTLQLSNKGAREILTKCKRNMKEIYDRNSNKIVLNIGDRIL